MSEKEVCATTDNISVLGFNVRVYNALRRSGITDIGELIRLAEYGDDALFAIRNLGEKGVAEIKERLSKVELLDEPPTDQVNESKKEWSGEPQILIDLGPPKILRYEVVEWLQLMVDRQIEAGTLHPQLRIDGYSLAEMVGIHTHTVGLYEILLKVLTAPISVAQELEHLFNIMPPREMDILIRRLGFERQTLQTIAPVLGVTRERVRQLEGQAWRRLQPRASTLPLVRIRSALLFAHDMNLSFNDWSNRLLNTGLLGDWSRGRFSHLDKIELVIVVGKLLEVAVEEFEIPETLKNIVKLHNAGMSDAPARMLDLLNRYSGEAERLVRRHLRYSGAVSLDWLVYQDSVDVSKRDLSLILESKDFFSVDENWYMSGRYVPDRLEKDSVFHRSLLKMFQVCGPLEISDVYFGLEHALIKTDFPRPPIGVLSKVLLRYGYDCEEGLWYWGGESNEELNSGERIIMRTLTENDGVAHHSQLAIAFINSSMSFGLLHATLRRSPLFDNFERSIYKLRGAVPGPASIQDGRDSGIETPMDLEYYFDMEGNITVHASLGTLAVGYGTITSAKLPNLVGNWNLAGFECESIEVEVTENEIRGLSRILQLLGCGIGDRIKMTFDTDTHEVFVMRFEQT